MARAKVKPIATAIQKSRSSLVAWGLMAVEREIGFLARF